MKESESGTLDLRINKKPKSPEYLGNHAMHGGSQSLLHGPSTKNNSHPSLVSAPIPPLQSPHLYKHPGAPPHEPPNSTFYAPHVSTHRLVLRLVSEITNNVTTSVCALFVTDGRSGENNEFRGAAVLENVALGGATAAHHATTPSYAFETNHVGSHQKGKRI